MDSRIEEMASVIKERCEQMKGGVDRNSNKSQFTDRLLMYGRIEVLASAILDEIGTYRIEHQEEY